MCKKVILHTKHRSFARPRIKMVSNQTEFENLVISPIIPVPPAHDLVIWHTQRCHQFWLWLTRLRILANFIAVRLYKQSFVIYNLETVLGGRGVQKFVSNPAEVLICRFKFVVTLVDNY